MAKLPRSNKVASEMAAEMGVTPEPVLSFEDKLSMDYYQCKLPYGPDPSGKTVYHMEVQRLGEEFRRDMEWSNSTESLPKVVRDRLYGKAWEDGHAYGYTEVSGHYSDLADLVKMVFEEGVKAGGR